MRIIGGLPIHVSFYDEFIPLDKDLTHVDDQGNHLHKVFFREWTKFWFRGSRKYVEPQPRMIKGNHLHKIIYPSFMDHGEIFSLAVPILANIYRDLMNISTSPNMGACNTLFPSHYVYIWIGEYCETYYRVTRPQQGVLMWQISREKMVKHFDLVDAHKLFQTSECV